LKAFVALIQVAAMGRVRRGGEEAAKSEAKAPLAPEKEEKKEEEAQKVEDPPIVKQLREIDDKYLELEREYEREVQKLLNEYTKKQQPLLEERKQVLTAPAEGGPATGTPILSSFWLKAMGNHPAFEDIIQEWDEPVLEFVTDIEKVQNEEDNSLGFKLIFHFLENPYFENTRLEKEYITLETNPYCGEMEVKEIKCSIIEWKAGKNVTVEKTVKKVKGGGAKKQKQKGKEKEEPRPSFFRDFFRNLKQGDELPEDAKMQAQMMMDEEDEEEEGDEELLAYLMDNDHEIGTALRDNIIPFAVRWYTGEAAPEMGEEGYDDEDSEEELDDEDSEEEDSEDDEPPKARGRGKAAPKKQGKAKGSPELKPAGDGKQEECKQQ